MKKFLLSLVVVGSFANAQILQQENFDALNTATIIGQGSPAYAKLNGANADYMVVAGGNSSKGLSINGSNTTGTGTTRYLWKDGLDTAWLARTAGNNILQIEYDYYTGAASTSTNGGGVELYDSTYAIYLGGLTVDTASKTVYGIYTDTGSVTLTNLGAGTTPAAVILPSNTWVRLGFAYNATTGAVTFKGPGFYKTFTNNDIAVPFELDYAVQDIVGTNAAASSHLFDNMVAKAVATETLLLGTSETSSIDASFSISPNPTTDFLNVNSKAKIYAVYIYDMSGIRVDAKLVDGKVDVRGLQTGAYMLGLKTENGLVTQKFIKK